MTPSRGRTGRISEAEGEEQKEDDQLKGESSYMTCMPRDRLNKTLVGLNGLWRNIESEAGGVGWQLL